MSSKIKITKKQEMEAKQQLMVLSQSGRLAEAKNLASQLVSALPGDMALWNALGQLQVQTGEPQKAMQSFANAGSKYSEIQASALSWLVDLCLQYGKEREGLPYARHLVKLQPNSAQTHADLGRMLGTQHCYVEAQAHLDKAIDLKSSHKASTEFKNYQFLAAINKIYLGQCESAIDVLDELIKQPGEVEKDASGNRPEVFAVWARNYIDGIDDDEILDVSARYNSSIPDVQNADQKRELKNRDFRRIGLCSPDLHQHSVAYFLKPILANLNSDKWQIYVYSDAKKFDHVSEKLKENSHKWQVTRNLSDEALAAQIVEDDIDILIDLVAYLGRVRLGCFALNPAPIQLTYLGYPNTTGLPQMDYRITDRWTDPEGMTEAYHTETLLRLPKGFLTFQADADAPTIKALPARENGYITFGSFNIFQKISERNYRLWAEILKRVPNSKLLIKSRPLNEEALQRSVTSKFEQAGVSADRIQVLGWTKEASSHLDTVGSVDIHLDTFPYNGTTTTCQAMWQGVPTITLAGNNHRSRVGYSLMSQVELGDWVAFDDEQYVELATEKAANLEELDQVRQSLRERMTSCALGNGEMFTEQLEACFETLIARHL